MGFFFYRIKVMGQHVGYAIGIHVSHSYIIRRFNRLSVRQQSDEGVVYIYPGNWKGEFGDDSLVFWNEFIEIINLIKTLSQDFGSVCRIGINIGGQGWG